MSKQIMNRLLMSVVVGITMIAVPTMSQAITVTSITVTAGAISFCDTTAACSNKIWNLGPGGADIGTALGKALILTQNAPIAGVSPGTFNFDLSDLAGSSGITSTITIVTSVGTLMFTDNNQTLTRPNGADTGGQHQEAVDWGTATGTINNVRLWLGYADNAHAGVAGDPKGTACADVSGDCFPGDGSLANPWQTTPTATFLGNAVTSTACARGTASCFDAGAIRIEAVAVATPEPSILLLLGTGLLGMLFVIQKQARKSIRY